MYVGDYDQGILPPADKWCDLLVGGNYCTARHFVCRESDAIVGESNVAINNNVAGKEPARFDPNVVLLFETDFGKDQRGRQELLKNRAWYKTMPYGAPETKVYKNRWNQAGGPEILTTKHNKGKGCNVVFVNGRVRFVKTEDLGKLKWK
jgi:hypothetical protein